MKYFTVIVLIAAAASAQPTRPSISAILGQLHEAISALKPEPVAVGPAVVDAGFEPIAVGPAIIGEPVAVGPAIIGEPIAVGPAIIGEPIAVGPALIPEHGLSPAPVVNPSPVAIIPGPAADVSASAPLVQIILNINQAAESSPIAVGPVVTPIEPSPVHVVESAAEPVQVVEVAPVPAEPVQVVEAAPVPVEPVIIGTPILPAPAVILPEELN